MFRINIFYGIVVAVIFALGVYAYFLKVQNEHLKQQLQNQEIAAHVQHEKDSAEIFSKDQLILIKENVHHDEVNTSVGTHTLHL